MACLGVVLGCGVTKNVSLFESEEEESESEESDESEESEELEEESEELW